MSLVHAHLATVAVDGMHSLHGAHAGDTKKVLKGQVTVLAMSCSPH